VGEATRGRLNTSAPRFSPASATLRRGKQRSGYSRTIDFACAPD